MKIKAILFLCLLSLLTLVNAQNQASTPDARKKADSRFKSICIKIKDDFPVWKNMKTSETAAICSCAIPLTLDSMIVDRLTDTDRIYALLTQNYFKCGEVKMKDYWAAHLQNKNKQLNQSQAICIADTQYQTILNSLESGAMPTRQELNRQTEHCY